MLDPGHNDPVRIDAMLANMIKCQHPPDVDESVAFWRFSVRLCVVTIRPAKLAQGDHGPKTSLPDRL